MKQKLKMIEKMKKNAVNKGDYEKLLEKYQPKMCKL